MFSFDVFRWPSEKYQNLGLPFLKASAVCQIQNNGCKGQTTSLPDQGTVWQRVPLHKFLPGQRRLPRAHTKVLQLQWDSEGLWPRQQDALWKPSHRPRSPGVRWVSKTRYVELTPLTCSALPCIFTCSAVCQSLRLVKTGSKACQHHLPVRV